MDAAQIEKLKALALAAPGAPWKVQHPYSRARGYEVADSSGLNQICENVTKQIADYIAAANPATVLELIAENERLRAEKEQAAQDAFALAWDQALSDAGFYVAGHCANGEHHAEIIMEMIVPKLTINGAQSMVERVEELAAGVARQGGGTSENMVVGKPAGNDAKTAETRMGTGFAGGGQVSAPAAGTEKDAGEPQE